MMDSVRERFINLTNIANQCAKTLRLIKTTARDTNSLTTGERFAAIGFVIGATIGIVTSTYFLGGLFMALGGPVSGLLGFLIGPIFARDATDRRNERQMEVIEQASELRDRHMAMLKKQIADARRTNSPALLVLEQQHAAFAIAGPDHLINYFGLSDRRATAARGGPPRIGPSESSMLETWHPQQAQAAIAHVHDDDG